MSSSTISSISTANVGKSLLNKGFSVWDLFIGADFVVQIVILLLIVASFWTWTIIFHKYKMISQLHKEADHFDKKFWSSQSLVDFYHDINNKRDNPISVLFCTAINEWQSIKKLGNKKTLHTQAERIERMLQLSMHDEMKDIEKNMIFLASVGSTAPFIGLFGTVWGIMHSFQDIAISGNTNLSVVAPGIAEALFATALGLIAAIPAVLAYNKLSSDINNYMTRLDNFCDTFVTIIARKYEEHSNKNAE